MVRKLLWPFVMACMIGSLVACAAEPEATVSGDEEDAVSAVDQTETEVDEANAEGEVETTTASTATDDEPESGAMLENAAPNATPPAEGEEVAVLDTAKGTIVLKFFPESAPNHVANFKKLANEGFYDGTHFHRVIPNFMIQGGDPNTKSEPRDDDGTGGPPDSVDAEFNDIKHVRGILSMARSQDPNSAGSQFFIMHAAYPSLDGQYSAFGQVVGGMDVVDAIVSVDVQVQPGNPMNPNNPIDYAEVRLNSVKIETWPLG